MDGCVCGAVGGLTIEAYLRGMVSYEVPDGALASIMLRRGLDFGVPAAALREKERELCTADLYMWCAGTPSAKNDTEDADAGWKHKEGGWQTSAYDKRLLRQMANDLYAKWGEEGGSRSRFVIKTF